MPKPLGHPVPGGLSLRQVEELEALVAVCPEGFLVLPTLPLGEELDFQQPSILGELVGAVTFTGSLWRLQFPGHR